jgi:hypothetical protein
MIAVNVVHGQDRQEDRRIGHHFVLGSAEKKTEFLHHQLRCRIVAIDLAPVDQLGENQIDCIPPLSGPARDEPSRGGRARPSARAREGLGAW